MFTTGSRQVDGNNLVSGRRENDYLIGAVIMAVRKAQSEQWLQSLKKN